MEQEEKKQVETKMKMLDSLINMRKDLIEFMEGTRGARLLEDLGGITRVALEDYLKNNSTENKVRANLSNQLYNLFVLFKDKIEFKNLVTEKESLIEYLSGLRTLDKEVSSPTQTGGAV